MLRCILYHTPLCLVAQINVPKGGGGHNLANWKNKVTKFVNLDHGLVYIFNCLRKFQSNELLNIQINVVGQDGKGVEGHGQMRFVYSYRVEASITDHLRDYAPCLEKYKVVQNFLM